MGKLLSIKQINKLIECNSPELLLNQQTVKFRFFHPLSNYSWHVISMVNKNTCFGVVSSGQCVELGYFDLEQIEQLHVRGLEVERDLYFKEVNAQVLMDKLNNR